MKTRGIRFSHKKENKLFPITDILCEINGEQFYWSILFLDATPIPEEGKYITALSESIDKLEKGLRMEWKELNMLAAKFSQIIDMVLIGSKDEHLLHRYERDQEMYETCDYVIVMFDSSYWEVFSKDEQFINRLVSKFEKTKFLESDYQS